CFSYKLVLSPSTVFCHISNCIFSDVSCKMISKQGRRMCAVKSKRLNGVVVYFLAYIKELCPSSRSFHASLIEQILILVHTAYVRLLCDTRKETCPLCTAVIEDSEAVI